MVVKPAGLKQTPNLLIENQTAMTTNKTKSNNLFVASALLELRVYGLTS
jgi:hypothetical protein